MATKSPLKLMTENTNTQFWNDSCSVKELTYAIENGGVGATTNPVIVGSVLRNEFTYWKDKLERLVNRHKNDTEVAITWKIIEKMAIKGASILLPTFEKSNGKYGRLSIQTNPQYYRNSEKIVKQALHFNTLAPNMQVKVPATSEGIKAIEELTYLGVNINATVSFSVSQAVAVAEAVERGFRRRKDDGYLNSGMTPVCTIMVGRVDDWIDVLAKRDGITIDPRAVPLAGVAVMRNAWKIFQERGYKIPLLAAAYRHLLTWSGLIGSGVIHTIPYGWQKKYNASGVIVKENMADPIDEHILSELYKFEDFVKAYEPNGLSVDEFDTYGPTVRTLRQFSSEYLSLVGFIRNIMLPDPDVKK